MLGELREAYPRVQRHRTQRPRETLCQRRAAASPGALCDTVLTNEKKQDYARSHSDNVEVSGNAHVVIGVRIVQCHHAIMSNAEFSTILNFPLLVPIINLLSGCINSSSLFPVAIYCTLLHRENMSFEVFCLQDSRRSHPADRAGPPPPSH